MNQPLEPRPFESSILSGKPCGYGGRYAKNKFRPRKLNSGLARTAGSIILCWGWLLERNMMIADVRENIWVRRHLSQK